MSFSELDAFIHSGENAPSEWRRVVPLAVSSLGEWLGQELATEPIEDMCLGEGFCIDVFPRSKHQMMPTWRGVLGGAIVDSKPFLSFSMFFVLDDKRLRTIDDEDYSEFMYVGKKQWKLLGTSKDEFGEFEGF